MDTPETRTYIQYVKLDPHSIDPIYRLERVPDRGLEHVQPKGEQAFLFFERTEIDLEDETLVGDARNVGILTYIDGEVYTYQTARREFPDNDSLFTVMDKLDISHVIRYGDTFYPFNQSTTERITTDELREHQ